MERLTRRMCGGWGVMPGYELNTVKGAKAIVGRLASFENTERTPEEIEELGHAKDKLDAAIEDIPHTCEYCAYNGVDVDVAPCADCEQMNTLFGEEHWEWRGMKEG